MQKHLLNLQVIVLYIIVNSFLKSEFGWRLGFFWTLKSLPPYNNVFWCIWLDSNQHRNCTIQLFSNMSSSNKSNIRNLVFQQRYRYIWYTLLDSNQWLSPRQGDTLASWVKGAYMVRVERLELSTPCLKGKCSADWATPSCGAPGEIRTLGLPIKSRMLCQLSYRRILVRVEGLEPSTHRLKVCYSTNWVTRASF